MEDFLWQLLTRTAETEFVFGLFHFLLACLMLLSGVRLTQAAPRGSSVSDSLLTFAAGFFALSFAAQGLAAGSLLYLERVWGLQALSVLGDATFIVGCALAASSLMERPRSKQLVKIALAALFLFTLLALAREGRALPPVQAAIAPAIVAAVLALGVRRGHIGFVRLVAGATLLAAALLRWAGPLTAEPWPAPFWHLEEHLLSLSLFAFAWMLGDRSTLLFDRVFVRLNLTLILLASLVILCNVGLERFQYLQLAEERTLPLAEYLRGHVLYFRERGVSLESIIEDPNVMRRLVTGFGELPGVQRIEIRNRGVSAKVEYRPDRTIDYSIEPVDAENEIHRKTWLVDADTGMKLYRLIHLPLDERSNLAGHIAFFSTLDSLNRHTGRSIILIYFVFTATAILGVIAVGFIVRSADLAIRANHRELAAAQQQLAQAAKLASLGELAAGVTHEINNPVTSILSTASHMVRKSRVPDLTETDRKQLHLISSQAQRISEIVNKLLIFARQSSMELSAADLNGLADTALELTRFRLTDDSVEIRKERSSVALPAVRVDRERIIEVLVNLLNNALDAMPDGGVLSIRTFLSRDESVCVSVSDTGVGMSPEVCDRVFDPFFTTKEPGKGTGLGLSISHGIMVDHGGEIRVFSQPDGGSTFSLAFPPGGPKDAETDPDRG